MPQGPIAGTASLKVNGNQIALKGNLTVSGSRVERTGIAGQDNVHGFQELPRVPYIEADISTVPEQTTTEELERLIDVTVQADLINGFSYVLRNAWCKGPIEINTHDGQFRIRFEGINCDEFRGGVPSQT
jgi:Phage tail tube protein